MYHQEHINTPLCQSTNMFTAKSPRYARKMVSSKSKSNRDYTMLFVIKAIMWASILWFAFEFAKDKNINWMVDHSYSSYFNKSADFECPLMVFNTCTNAMDFFKETISPVFWARYTNATNA